MIVIDNFVKDPQLLSQIDDVTNDFWDTGYSWWQASSPSVTLRHKLIDYIWMQGRVPMPESYAGFEHWIGIYDSTGKKSSVEQQDLTGEDYCQGEQVFDLVHHMDKDEAHWHKTGEIVSPSIGCIYYPPIGEQCEGGFLRIYDTLDVDYSAPYELIKPVQNRLIVFNPGQLHAVQKTTKGLRYAIAINVWENKLSTDQMSNMQEVI